jgi:hypothetical protein
MEKTMETVEARQSDEAHANFTDLRFLFACAGSIICMLVTIYIDALYPGNTLVDLASMSVFP